MRKYGDSVVKELILTAEQRKKMVDIMNRPMNDRVTQIKQKEL
jgi:Spy/CpxP family protein refolding chaperone